MENKQQESELNMQPHRLEALTDGIFAFAMTLLVLSINLPTPNATADVGAYIVSQFQNFWTFAISFLLLAFFWVNYSQQYHHIKKTDAVTFRLNIFILLFVVLMPFSTSLMNDFTSDRSAELFFNGNFLILCVLLLINWQYCLRKHYIEVTNAKHIAVASRNFLFLLIPPLLALGICFIYPGWSTLSYLLIPILLFFSKK